MKVSRAMSRILRHSKTLTVNKSGFAWMADLISTIWQDDHLWATPAQVLYVVARDLKSRFQAVQQPGSYGLDPTLSAQSTGIRHQFKSKFMTSKRTQLSATHLQS